MPSNYYITHQTNELVSCDAYAELAGKCIEKLKDVYENESLTSFTEGNFETVDVEIEISHEQAGLLMSSVLTFDSPGVSLSKPKLTGVLVKNFSDIFAAKPTISKRQLSDDFEATVV